jgi:hypothetical protein
MTANTRGSKGSSTAGDCGHFTDFLSYPFATTLFFVKCEGPVAFMGAKLDKIVQSTMEGIIYVD